MDQGAGVVGRQAAAMGIELLLEEKYFACRSRAISMQALELARGPGGLSQTGRRALGWSQFRPRLHWLQRCGFLSRRLRLSRVLRA